MNLIFIKRGYPISNIRREDRPAYYDALAFADVGIYDPLITLVHGRSADLFSEYVRIREETRRVAEWAARWGDREAEVLHKREAREWELWQSRVRQVFLEFEKAAELLDERLEQISVSFYDYKNDVTFEKYQQLLESGFIDHANAFSITFTATLTGYTHRFMFRYYRNFHKFPGGSRIIPLELNYFDPDAVKYVRLSDLGWAERLRMRELYFTLEGEFMLRYFNVDTRQETERKPNTVAEAVQWFYDDVLHNVLGLH